MFLILISGGRILIFVWVFIGWFLVCGEGLVVSRGISIFYALDFAAKKFLYSFSSTIMIFCDITRDCS
jgi:hypothetical protein